MMRYRMSLSSPKSGKDFGHRRNQDPTLAYAGFRGNQLDFYPIERVLVSCCASENDPHSEPAAFYMPINPQREGMQCVWRFAFLYKNRATAPLDLLLQPFHNHRDRFLMILN